MYDAREHGHLGPGLPRKPHVSAPIRNRLSSTPETAQGSHTGVDAMTDEDDAATDAVFTCVDALTGRPPSTARAEFTGESLAVAVEVLLVISASDLVELTTPHVPEETATQNAIQAMVNRRVHTLSPHDMEVPRKVARNVTTQSVHGAAPAILKAARFVLTILQRGAIAQVTAIAHASPPTPAVKVPKQSFGSIVTLAAAGVSVVPAYQPMGDLHRRTSQRPPSDAALVHSGQDFPVLSEPQTHQRRSS